MIFILSYSTLHDFAYRAGYGERPDEMSEYITAEEMGRQKGHCEDIFSECPMSIGDFMQSGLSIIQSGLVSASGMPAIF